MANIKSSIKRISVTKTKQAQNKPIKSNLATEIKKFQTSVAAGELKHAESQLSVVFAALDSAAADHVIHKNKANRQKAKLSAMLAKATNKGKAKAAKTTATTAAKPAATAKAATPAATKTAAPKATAAKTAAKPATKTATTKTAAKPAATKTATKTTKPAAKASK